MMIFFFIFILKYIKCIQGIIWFSKNGEKKLVFFFFILVDYVLSPFFAQ